MSDRNGRGDPKAGLEIVAAVIAIAVAVGIAMGWSAEITGGRATTEPRAQQQCPHGKDCPDSDLHAQIRVADASETMVDFGLLQLLFGGVGLVGLGFTVLYARRAWKESQAAAQSAAKSLEHTERLAKAELRPWVHIDIVPVVVEITPVSITIEVELVFQNIGATAARNIQPYWDLFLNHERYQEGVGPTREHWRSQRAKHLGVIMPGERFSVKLWEGNKHSIVPWQKQDTGEYIWPYVTASAFYTSDVDNEWKETHRTVLLAGPRDRLGIRGIPKVEGTLSPPTLDARNHGATVAT